MRKEVFVAMALAIIVLSGGVWEANAGPPENVTGKECFFLKSLHFTANGMKYWYSKENGGLETISGIPYSKLGCKNCHVGGCDRCHRTEQGKRLSYTLKASQKQNMCLKCHGREKAMMRINHAAKTEDVHVAKGMTCTDCHSKREMHGDGTEYKSLKQPGAMDTRCEKCHDTIKPTDAHTTHEGKLDCKACHIRHVVSCTNCHFDHLVKTGKRKAIPVHGWLFLMNYKGKVSSASMQTFLVLPNKTFLMFAPHMSHSIMKKGRQCNDCHGTKTVQKVNKEKKLTLTWLEDGKVKNLKGIIPVAKGVQYECAYQDLRDGKWVPVKDPAKPGLQFAAFGEPLTKEQLEALSEIQEVPTPQMEDAGKTN
jgi:hypothetical protein